MTESNKSPEQLMQEALSSINNQEQINEDVLDLAEADIISQEDEPEELIDIKSFDATGEIKPANEQSQLLAKAQHGNSKAIEELSKQIVDEPKANSEYDNADDVLNKLGSFSSNNEDLNENLSSKAEQLEKVSQSYSEKEFEPSNDEDAPIEDDNTPKKAASQEDIARAMAALQEKEKAIEERVKPKINKTMNLKAIPGPSGLQVGFPVEVLAEALRPMISGWIEDNLPQIVEKLVKEELTKLADE